MIGFDPLSGTLERDRPADVVAGKFAFDPLSGAIRWALGIEFSPLSLFAAGEQGAWYDPSDLSTMFTDAAGTTPITGVEQAVGLILDKSNGLVVGSNVIINGDFSSGTGWSTHTGTSITGGEGVFTATSSGAGIFQTGKQTAGITYKITYTCTSYTSGSFSVYAGGVKGVTRSSTGTFTEYVIIPSTSVNTNIGVFAVTTCTAKIDNVSAVSIAGNHASQTTSAARPVLRARYNLLTYTEQFNNAAWATANRFTISTNTSETTDPLGGNTANKGTETVDNGTHQVAQEIIWTAISYTSSCYFKKGTRRWVYVAVGVRNTNNTDTTQVFKYFDLDDIALGQTQKNQTAGTINMVDYVTASISDAGNDWRRCSMTFTVKSIPLTTKSSASTVFYGITPADGTSSYVGETNQYGYIWGADLRVANDGVNLPPYQRVGAGIPTTSGSTTPPVAGVTGTADYDTVGFPPYLFWDGVDDCLFTSAINFTATDKMTVWAGVRKLSDEAAGVIAEYSANVSTNNGAFVLSAAGTPAYSLALRGTATASYAPATYTAPITNVISGAFNIGGSAIGDEIIPRVDGVIKQTSPSGANAGTGNFGNYPLFIGRRNNASLQFNGRLYSLCIRGAQSTDEQIVKMESWVNSKTKAYA